MQERLANPAYIGKHPVPAVARSKERQALQQPLIEVREQRHPISRDKRQPSSAAAGATPKFGRFTVLLRRRQMLADGVPVKRGTRAFDLLTVLIEADGLLVTKDELLIRVWSGIVAQDNLMVQISALHRALGDDRDFIQTESKLSSAADIGSPRWSAARLSPRRRAWRGSTQPRRRSGQNLLHWNTQRSAHEWRASRSESGTAPAQNASVIPSGCRGGSPGWVLPVAGLACAGPS